MTKLVASPLRPWSLARLPRASAVDGLGLVLLTLVVLVVFLDEPHVLPRSADTVNLAPRMLPLYAGYSLARMLAAYLLSLGFAIAAGYWAASSKAARRVILPVLDVLQAVPILGFFPAAIFFFVRLFRGSPLGVEVAAVFLIFTSQAWNMAFSVYESLTTIPEDVATAVTMSRASGVVLWRRLLLPACVPHLVYNSMLSWAGGWYFLIASEVIAVGRQTYVLPGLGSYIGESILTGRDGLAALGIAALVLVIVLLHLFAWSPLEAWAHRFRYETSSGLSARPPFAQRLLRRTPLLRGALARVARLAGGVVGRAAPVASHAVAGPWLRPALVAAGLATLAGLAWGAVLTARVLLRPLPPEAAAIPSALAASFLRLLIAYAISLAWTIPLAAWVSRSAVRAERLVPIAQVLASLPATAFFPVIIVLALRFGLGLDVGAVALVLTGMQWYIFFNLIAAAQALPEELRELARASGARGFLYLRRFFIPAALPSLITGSLTAWGGGWNALVLSESVTVSGRTWAVHGIGALLDRATYVSGDLQMITLVIVSMVVTVLLLNRALWRPLYAWAALRYKLDV